MTALWVCVSISSSSSMCNSCVSSSWMSTILPILLGFFYINFSPWLFPPCRFHSSTLNLFSAASSLSLSTLVCSVSRFLKCESIMQCDVLIPWCPWEQRPSSSWTWAVSMISSPAVANSGLRKTQYIFATVIMSANIIHFVGIQDSIGGFHQSIV